jgi:hypothetical protein
MIVTSAADLKESDQVTQGLVENNLMLGVV